MKISIGSSAGERVGFDLEELLKTRLLIQADSGGGKSWLIRVLAERLFGKVQVILIDPEGEFATLRSREDLAAAAGASPTSSAFNNNLGAMRSAGMIDYGSDRTVVMQGWILLQEKR